MKPRYNETLYNEVLGIKKDFRYPSNSKIYEKEPRYNETGHNLVIANKFRQSLGSSLYLGSTVPLSLKTSEVLLINCKLLKSLIGGGIYYVSKRIQRLSFNFVVRELRVKLL